MVQYRTSRSASAERWCPDGLWNFLESLIYPLIISMLFIIDTSMAFVQREHQQPGHAGAGTAPMLTA